MKTSDTGRWRIERANTKRGRSDWPRVGLVHSFYRSSLPSGENSAVLRQFSMLAAHGVDVTLFGIHTDDVVTHPLETVRTGISVASGVGYTFPTEIIEKGVDVVHVHNTFPNISHKWLRQLPLPTLVTIHNYRAFCAKGTFSRTGKACFECVEKSPWRAIRHSCYQSSKLATLPVVIQQLGPRSWLDFLASLPLVLIPGESMQDFFRHMGLTNTQLLPHPTAGSNSHLPSLGNRSQEWIFVGRLDLDKGIDDLLRIWPPNERLSIIGVGPLQERCQQIVSKRQLRVRLLGGMSPGQVSNLMRTSRGLIFPSIAMEGAPLVYAEALAAGLPVIAAAGNVLAEQVEVDGTGASFLLGDEASLRDGMGQVIERWEYLSSRCIQVHSERYSEKQWLTGLRAAYLSIATHAKTP